MEQQNHVRHPKPFRLRASCAEYSNSFEARDGNSGLKPFTGYNNTLSASWNIPLMSVYLEGNWTYLSKPIATSILPEKREDGSYLFVSEPGIRRVMITSTCC